MIGIDALQDTLEKCVDGLMALIPRKRPAREKLLNAKLIAHRGNGFGETENTLSAFRSVQAAGVFGIEFDVRFTEDHVPVLCHDLTLVRCFGIDHAVETKSFSELYKLKTEIPTLAEVINEFKNRLHFMIEIKARQGGLSDHAVRSLREVLQDLVPGRDYHLMSLEPELFDRFYWVPKTACLSISILNTKRIAKETIERALGGHTGHYVLITKSLREDHARRSQKIGTGFISSRNVLYREIERNTDWLFSNNAFELQKYLRESP